jgi:hypothetical protein
VLIDSDKAKLALEPVERDVSEIVLFQLLGRPPRCLLFDFFIEVLSDWMLLQ